MHPGPSGGGAVAERGRQGFFLSDPDVHACGKQGQVEPSKVLPWLTCVSLQYLLHYLVSLKNWLNRYSWQRTPISVTAWALLRDSYHGGLCLRFRAQHLAVAVLYLALQVYGVEVPAEAEAEKPWWQVRWRCGTLGPALPLPFHRPQRGTRSSF